MRLVKIDVIRSSVGSYSVTLHFFDYMMLTDKRRKFKVKAANSANAVIATLRMAGIRN